ncbi:hypothetical protein Tco_0704283 [Tanacetum coccineum]|uniref:Uncharacterized protein n=1 Tax=Tanacetum coccineum TaxID=301880 RepID=A0ABQ4Y350_9ASTR
MPAAGGRRWWRLVADEGVAGCGEEDKACGSGSAMLSERWSIRVVRWRGDGERGRDVCTTLRSGWRVGELKTGDRRKTPPKTSLEQRPEREERGGRKNDDISSGCFVRERKELNKEENKDRGDELDNVKKDGGCLQGGSEDSGRKRLSISMVVEAWLSEKETGVIERQRVFSLKRKSVSVEEK